LSRRCVTDAPHLEGVGDEAVEAFQDDGRHLTLRDDIRPSVMTSGSLSRPNAPADGRPIWFAWLDGAPVAMAAGPAAAGNPGQVLPAPISPTRPVSPTRSSVRKPAMPGLQSTAHAGVEPASASLSCPSLISATLAG
jgi:hypothetical protein